MAKKGKRIKREGIVETITLPLTQQDLEQLCDELGTVETRIDALEDEKRDAGARLKGANAERDTITRKLAAREEAREVTCNRVYDLPSGFTWLEFEGEEYDRRAMTKDEYEAAANPGLFRDHPGMAGKPKIVVSPDEPPRDHPALPPSDRMDADDDERTIDVDATEPKEPS